MPDRERPETAAPTKVVKMKLAPAAKPSASPEPKEAMFATGSSPPKQVSRGAAAARPMLKPPTLPPPSPMRPASDPPEISGAEPATTPIVAGTKRASVAPPPRPSSLPPMRRPIAPVGLASASATAPRVSSALVSPAALAARTADGGPQLRVVGTMVPNGSPEPTAIVRRLPLPDGSPEAAVEVPAGEVRRRRLDLSKWLIGGAVAAGALVVAILAGAFDRPSLPDPAASAMPAQGEDQATPRKKRRVIEDPELRSSSDPPRTVGNSQASSPSGSTPAAQEAVAAKPAAPTEEVSPPPARPEPEPAPPDTAKRVTQEASPRPEPEPPPPDTAKRVTQEASPRPEPEPAPPESAKPAVAAKAPPATKPAAVVAKPPAPVVKPHAAATKPPATRKPPATKPAARPQTTPPKWDPDSLFLK